MPGTTTFHLVRHGHYGLLGHALAGRLGGYSLSDEGRAQAEAVAGALADHPIVAVVSSPLERTRETAAPIAARLGLDVQIDPDVIEIDFGEWTGRSFESLREWSGWASFSRFRSTARVPGGESMLAVQARSLAAVVRWREAVPDGDVVIVSHGDVIKSILAHFLTIPLDMFRRFDVAPASRSVVQLYDEDARVLAVNLPPPTQAA
jgi:probable phosphoglycerate mutase